MFENFGMQLLVFRETPCCREVVRDGLDYA